MKIKTDTRRKLNNSIDFGIHSSKYIHIPYRTSYNKDSIITRIHNLCSLIKRIKKKENGGEKKIQKRLTDFRITNIL